MKKILMLTHHNIKAGSGGDVARVKKIARLLIGSYEVRMFGLGYSPKRLYLLPIWMFRLAREIKVADWDFVYVYNQRYIVLLAWALRLLLSKRYRLIYDAVLTWKLLAYPWVYKWFRDKVERLAGKCSDGVIAVSELSRDFFSEKTILVVPTLVDTDVFKMDKESRLRERGHYGIEEGNKVVGVIGPFIDNYNRPSLDYLYGNIARFNERIKFLIIGKLNEQDTISHKRIAYAGYVQDYVGCLSALDALLVVRKVQTDGAINRIVEAMAMGLPVFANSVAGRTMDYGIPKKDHFVFDDGGLPSKMNKILFNGRTVSRVGKNARYVAEGFYSEKECKYDLLETLLQW